jgi:hypothetical protein
VILKDFTDSIEDAYKKRNNKCISLRVYYPFRGFRYVNLVKGQFKGVKTHKVKKIRVKKRKLSK